MDGWSEFGWSQERMKGWKEAGMDPGTINSIRNGLGEGFQGRGRRRRGGKL